MDAIKILVAVLGSTALSQLITFFVTRHDTRKAKEDEELANIVEGVKALLHDSIFSTAIDCLNKGEITTHAYDNLKIKYGAYSKLHGNGTGKDLMEKVKVNCKIVDD